MNLAKGKKIGLDFDMKSVQELLNQTSFIMKKNSN